MRFDRYAVLTKHYSEQIRKWDWSAVERNLLEYEPEGFDPHYDEPLVGFWLGTLLGVFPSGKIYTAWTTNQKRSDIVRDECFLGALQEAASKRGFFVDYDDDSVFLVRPKK